MSTTKELIRRLTARPASANNSYQEVLLATAMQEVYEASKQGGDMRDEACAALPGRTAQVEAAHLDGVGARTPAVRRTIALAQLGLREITPVVVEPDPVAPEPVVVEPVAEPSWPRLTHAEWHFHPGTPAFLHPGWGF